MRANQTTEKTELHNYLDAINLEDLEMMTRERRSTKKLDGGPMI